MAYAASCDSAATIAADVWKRYREVSEAIGCKSPLGGPAEYVSCSVTRFVNESTEDITGWWNTVAKNRWATIGPRILGAEKEIGTVIVGTRRTFVSLVPSFNQGTIIIDPRSGQGDVTICATDAQGRTTKIVNDVTVKNQPRPFNMTKANAEGKVLSVVLNATAVAFGYSIHKTEAPIQWHFGKIKGLADLHNHQAAELGYAGLWLRGSHDGPRNEALPACRQVNIGNALTGSAKAVAIASELGALPAGEQEKLHALPINQANHEGEQVLRHGDGHNAYTAWPHFSDIAHQQVPADWLKEAYDHGLKVLVVSAVNNEVLCRGLRVLYPGKNDFACDDMSNLKLQVKAFNEFDRKHDWYEIALHPWHARKIIHEGKLAVVVAAESSHMFPPSEGDFKAQLDELYRMGLRSLQIVHERDNRFAGAAPHRSNFIPHQITSNPLTTLKAWFEGDKFDTHWVGSFDLENGKNRKGLLGPGYELVDAMVQRRLLIDASHYSEKAFDDLYNLVKSKYDNYPFFLSHTRFKARLEDHERDVLREFLTTDDQAKKIRELGGIIGLRTGATHVSKDKNFDSGVLNDCAGSSKSYAQLVAHAKKLGVAIAFGTDFNGVTQQIAPRYGSKEDRCYAAVQTQRGINAPQGAKPAGVAERFNTDGLRHMGYLPDLYDDLVALKTNGVAALDDGAEQFIQMWEKVYGVEVAMTTNESCKADTDCGQGEWCDAGADLKGNTCRPLRKDGEACPAVGGGHACRSEHCQFGQCYTPQSVAMGDACFVNDQCRQGKCSNTVLGTTGECVCDADQQCGKGRYCDEGWLTIGKNQCVAFKAYGAACSRDEQCESPAICKGKPAGKCITEAAINLGGRCIKDAECESGSCDDDGRCQCKVNADCGRGKYCDTGTAGIGKNSCKAFKQQGDACSADKQCGSGLDCKGVVGFKTCK
jgi:microsomal dipeptidase-like Zn-dependent dipeptidase